MVSSDLVFLYNRKLESHGKFLYWFLLWRSNSIKNLVNASPVANPPTWAANAIESDATEPMNT